MNRLTQTMDANGGTFQYTYDNNGNILTFTDANGHTTSFVYDALNRQVNSTDALGHTTTHVYDANGNMTSITDAKGQTTSYTYDANGQLTQISFADGKTRTFEYDGNGNVIRQKDEANRYTTFAYDALNRLTTKTYPDNSTHQFTYDLSGNMLSAVNANATVQFTYDAAGQALSETLNGKATTYSYNTRQRMVDITYPGGRSITEQYDYRGRLAAIVESGNNVVSFNYNNNDFLTQRTYQNGTATNYTYDLLNRLTRIMDNPQVADVEMTYDAVGNILSKKDLLHPTKSEAYSYDAVNQLIGFKKGTMATGVEIPNPMRQIQYVLDAVGNHSTVTEDGQTTTYIANSRNAYTTVSGTSNYTPQYDANGNLAQDDHHTFAYDFDNHLISVDNGNTAIYTYDALGRRVTKSIVSPNATTIHYYYSGDQIIEERDAADNMTATYLYGISIDDILQMHRNGQDYWYHKNHLGSVVALTNEQGSVIERYEYDPYGKLTIYDANDSVLTVSAVGNIYYFTGREYDFETGLYHYRARSLHPGLGRFMQHDPLMYLDAMGLYHYVGNMPTMMVDPNGLEGCEKAKPNGCGPAGFGWAIPDGVFHEACNQHDDCYNMKADENKYWEHKKECDQKFLEDMKKARDHFLEYEKKLEEKINKEIEPRMSQIKAECPLCGTYAIAELNLRKEAREKIAPELKKEYGIQEGYDYVPGGFSGPDIYKWAVVTFGDTAYEDAQFQAGNEYAKLQKLKRFNKKTGLLK